MATIYKRGGTWWGRIMRQGREYRRSLETANRATAQSRLAAWKQELEGTGFGEKPRRSYADAEDRFIKEHLPALKPSGALRYGVSLKNLAAHFGAKMLHDIGSGLLSEFESKRRTERVELSNGRHKIGVSASTIRRDLACLSSLMGDAVEWEWIDANPVPAYLKRRSKRGLKEAPPKTRYLTEEEERRLLDSILSPALYNAIVLAIDTGLRQRELFSLEWSQVDFHKRIITTTTNTKSGRVRSVPLSPRSAAILAGLPRSNRLNHVFINPATLEPYTSMKDGLEPAYARAKIARLTWHDLRRTAGCRWLQRDRMSMAGSRSSWAIHRSW